MADIHPPCVRAVCFSVAKITQAAHGGKPEEGRGKYNIKYQVICPALFPFDPALAPWGLAKHRLSDLAAVLLASGEIAKRAGRGSKVAKWLEGAGVGIER